MYHIIYYILVIPLSLITIHFVLLGLFAFKRSGNSYSQCPPKHRFATVIPARNERAVIANLVESLRLQSYPKGLFDIYVVPNNCTDETEEVAIAAGAEILYPSGPVHSKGEVLEQVFRQLGEMKKYDAVLVFDADNLVHPEFIARMNDALCAGVQVAQGYRDSKNPGDSWVSSCSAIYYWLLNIFYDSARANIGQSAVINGTGFMLKMELLEEMGYHPVTLTEDIEFSVQCAIAGKRIAFVPQAVVYDEQPIDLLTSIKQRKRWSAGAYQCLFTYGRQLFDSMLKRKSLLSLDMLLMCTSPLVQIVYFLISLILLVYNFSGVRINDAFSLFFAYYEGASLLITYLVQAGIALLTVVMCRKRLRDTFPGILLFNIFFLTWLPINILCLFDRHIEWDPIKHTKAIDIKAAMKEEA